MGQISDLVPDVMLYTPGAPDILVEQKILDAAIEFCNLSGYWQQELDPFETIATNDNYDIDTPSDSVIRHILSLSVNGLTIYPSKTVELDRRSQGWRTRTGPPKRFVMKSMTELMLTPIPDAVYPVTAFASLRPSKDATEIPDILIDFKREEIVAGAIFKLLTIPGRQWTDMQTAGFYRQQFYRGVKQARIDANKQYSNATQFTNHKPIA